MSGIREQEQRLGRIWCELSGSAKVKLMQAGDGLDPIILKLREIAELRGRVQRAEAARQRDLETLETLVTQTDRELTGLRTERDQAKAALGRALALLREFRAGCLPDQNGMYGRPKDLEDIDAILVDPQGRAALERQRELQASFEDVSATLASMTADVVHRDRDLAAAREEIERLREASQGLLTAIHWWREGGLRPAGGLQAEQKLKDALAAAPAPSAAPTRAEARDGPCHYCGTPTESHAGNPGLWPLWFSHADEPGVAKAHHWRCFQHRLREPTRAEQAARCAVCGRAQAECACGQ